ncbi:MAG: aminopeptidase, partial [Candidatus Zixiibacteriota bacterium]
KSFANEFLGDEVPEYATLVNLPTREFNNLFELEDSRNLFEKEDMVVLNLTSEKLQEYTLASLKDSQLVWFACDVGKENYGDSGILAIDIYDYNRTFDMDFKMSKKDRINFNEISPNHAMTIMGADTTDSGKVKKWLIENSWGSKRGDDGYWYMYNDWFDEYVLMVIIDKKLLSEKDLKLYDKKPIKIPTWEPFFLALRRLEKIK